MGNYKKTPTIYQMEATECGAASLSMIFAYYGKHLPLERMRIETGVSRDGCNARNMMRAAKKHGIDCRGYRKELDDLKQIKTPCIIHWNFNHFVVFEGMKGAKAYLNDPASGRRKITIEELDEGFTGIVLTFNLTKDFIKSKKPKKLTGFIKQRLRGQYSTLFKLFYIGLLLVFPGLLLPILSQIFVDDILIGGNLNWFNQFLIFMGLTITLKCGLTFYRNHVLFKLRNKLVLLSTRSFLYHMFRLPIGFFDQRYTGDLVGRVGNNEDVSNFLAGELAETVLNIIIASFYLALLLLYSIELTAIGLISVAFNLLLVKITSNTISNLSIKMQQDSGKLHGALCAGLSITSTLKASGAENEYIARIIGYSAKTINLEQKLSKTQSILDAIPDAVSTISDVIVLAVGAVFIIQGNITVGILIAFTSLFNSFTDPIDKLVGFMKKTQIQKANMSRVEDIMNYSLDFKFDDKPKKVDIKTKLQGNVELKNISFGYSTLAKPLIEDFSFKLASGKSIAFVGSSGCGKSTISKVISGLYNPWSGKIFMDGHELETLPKEVINASISTVSQNITLFSGTIRDNLTMWNSSILESDIISAAKDACIHDVITKKTGAYDHHLTEGATNLSGGQRQRLEIARALVTNPTILIMDEATSALDPIVEKKILDNIKRRGCTCIIVAHRVSAIRDCDEIILMENGKIVQKGTHEVLNNPDGPYKEFIRNT